MSAIRHPERRHHHQHDSTRPLGLAVHHAAGHVAVGVVLRRVGARPDHPSLRSGRAAQGPTLVEPLLAGHHPSLSSGQAVRSLEPCPEPSEGPPLP